ncbi:MAG: hypothetical protein RIC15_12765 [Vicingaceae bacterium]
MKPTIVNAVLAVLILTLGCSKPVEDPGPVKKPTAYTKLFLKFTHNVNGVDLNATDTIIYENLSGNIYSIKNLKYLISDVRLNNFNYDNYQIGEWHLVDVKDESSLVFEVKDSIIFGDYASVSLFVGFLEEQNKTGEYPELDNLGWSWKPQRGGGYYTLQADGRFFSSNVDVIPDPFDIGLGGNKLVVTQSDSSYVANEIVASLKSSGFTVPRGTPVVTIEIQMNVNKLFESTGGAPNFNLDTWPTGLEDNSAGSSALSGNITAAFKLGEVTYGLPK